MSSALCDRCGATIVPHEIHSCPNPDPALNRLMAVTIIVSKGQFDRLKNNPAFAEIPKWERDDNAVASILMMRRIWMLQRTFVTLEVMDTRVWYRIIEIKDGKTVRGGLSDKWYDDPITALNEGYKKLATYIQQEAQADGNAEG